MGHESDKRRGEKKCHQKTKQNPLLFCKVKMILVVHQKFSMEILLASVKRKRKKQSRALKPAEKMIFSMAKRYDKATKEYRDRHEKSNKKKKNGWIKDFAKNYNKAMSKAGGGGMGLPGMSSFKL